jgi:hypothetical protein
MRSCSVEARQSCSTACSMVVLNQTSSTDPYSQTHTDGTLRTLLSPRRALHQLTTSPPPSQCSKAGAESCRRRWLQHARCGPVRSMHVGRATGGDRNTNCRCRWGADATLGQCRETMRSRTYLRGAKTGFVQERFAGDSKEAQPSEEDGSISTRR